VGLDLSDSEWIPLASCCEGGNEPYGSIKGGSLFHSWVLSSQEGLCSMDFILVTLIWNVMNGFYTMGSRFSCRVKHCSSSCLLVARKFFLAGAVLEIGWQYGAWSQPYLRRIT
jgi:hypothetical protein